MSWFSNLFKRNKENRELNYVNPYTMGIGLSSTSDSSGYKATTLSAIYSAIELISNSIAGMPINVKNKKENVVTDIDTHPLYHLFDNSLTTKFTLVKQMVSDMLLHGNGFAYIERANDGTPIELIYRPLGKVTIDYNEQKQQLYYIDTEMSKKKIEPINMIHILKNSIDGVHGLGVIHYATRSINLANYTENAASTFFSSGCQIGGILTTDSPRLTEQQRTSIRTAWNEAHGGGKSGLAILEANMKYQAVNSNAKESQLLESRLYNLQEIARFFNISPTLLGDLSKSSYSTIEASQTEFVMHCLLPIVEMIESELKRKLLKPSEISSGLYIDIDESSIMKATKNEQATYLNTLTSGGIMTVNEARHVLGLNPMEGCDKLIIPYTNIKDNTVNNDNGNDESGDVVDNSDIDSDDEE